MDAFAGYLASLVGSWEALATPHPDASVVRGAGFVAARFPSHPVLCNAVLLDPAALPALAGLYTGIPGYAVWSADGATAAVLAAAGMRRDETTVPMRCDLRDLPPGADPADGSPGVVADADPGVVAAITGTDETLVRGVPGLRAYASAGHESCLVLIPVGSDVNVSFVATLPRARRRGLARSVLRRALHDARDGGFATASLQATPMAERLYAAEGFAAVGAWQEWLPRS
ncbi:GNAT family N-acetyltransferase [Dactylosporangium aurantiacum]|uniref:GNAT family N-acetyltransferase n=1 Tax=Dactylosporangium aurantiacum TaxID=35754 RepID=A0A9Q9IQT3_9ACTN|nr:GNAT family N-acetyltransferase [Dactylosporangium aurantiacum]MDG6103152.1 GNAT family N-acetyltransferase [Dactylosporangium aurantiacum]UWZ57660.1 GNAT family N-acetyltransferase [Dactylosporangium aurantiacum]